MASRLPCQEEGCWREAGAAGKWCDVHYRYERLPEPVGPMTPEKARQWLEDVAELKKREAALREARR